VFQNQPLEEILELQKVYELDIVQLHGDEPLEWANLIPVPVIRSFKPGQSGLARRGYHTVPLLDSGSGGSGQKLDMSEVKGVLTKDQGLRVLLAGGLNPDNVADAVRAAGNLGDRIIGVDVSSGVEEGGAQSVAKIQAFIKAARSVR
jgi:anthranilate synthase/indole-3-glycerol phosphate synthase/phosphoribosylanthranilate isomerase